MKKAKESMVLMHPLPRAGEIDTAVDVDPRSAFFRQMDTDGSGRITFDEFTDAVRRELGIPPEEIRDAELHSLWLALDADLSGFVTAGEFGVFMRKGEPVEVAIPVTLDASTAMSAGAKAMASGRLDLRIRGTAALRVLIFPVTISFDERLEPPKR